MRRITINGLTGDETPEETDKLTDDLLLHLRQHAAGATHDEAVAYAEQKLHAFHGGKTAARYHNGMVDAANTDTAVAELSLTAITEVDTAWMELSTAENWLAAHHRFVCAVTEARDELAVWTKARAAVRARHDELIGQSNTAAVLRAYRTYAPAEEQYVLPDPLQPERVSASFERIAERRLRITSYTTGTARLTGQEDGAPRR